MSANKQKHSYELIYGNAKGLAEIIRLVFAAGKVEYKDTRVPQDEMPEKKKGFPFKVVPILVIDGKQQFCQSTAIARYVAAEFGLLGSTNLEMLAIMEIEEVFKDLMTQLLGIFAASEDKKEELKQKIKSEFFPKVLEFVTMRLKSNNGGDGWMVGKKLSYADLVVFNGFQIVKSFLYGGEEVLTDNDLLRAHSERVGSDTNIKAWLEKRPVTAM